jgi:hypothetical protein
MPNPFNTSPAIGGRCHQVSATRALHCADLATARHAEVVDPLINSCGQLLHHRDWGVHSETAVKIINHVLNLEIDKFKLEHGRVPSVMRLGRKHLASLLESDDEYALQGSTPIIYREIPIVPVDEDWHLAVD